MAALKEISKGFHDVYRAYRSKKLVSRFVITTGAFLLGLMLVLFVLTALLTGDAGTALSILIGAAPPFPHAAWAAWAAVPLALVGWVAVPVLIASVYSIVINEAAVARARKVKKLLQDEMDDAGGTGGL